MELNKQIIIAMLAAAAAFGQGNTSGYDLSGLATAGSDQFSSNGGGMPQPYANNQGCPLNTRRYYPPQNSYDQFSGCLTGGQAHMAGYDTSRFNTPVGQNQQGNLPGYGNQTRGTSLDPGVQANQYQQWQQQPQQQTSQNQPPQYQQPTQQQYGQPPSNQQQWQQQQQNAAQQQQQFLQQQQLQQQQALQRQQQWLQQQQQIQQQRLQQQLQWQQQMRNAR